MFVPLPSRALRVMSWVAFIILLADVAQAETLARPRANLEHPLVRTIKLAQAYRRNIELNIDDYSCLLIKRERVDGKLNDYEYIRVKVRNEKVSRSEEGQRFAAYLRFLAPSRFENREVLFVDGQNNGELVVRNGGKRLSFVTLSLDPYGDAAMRGNRYPITDLGIAKLIDRLIEVGEECLLVDRERRECRVKYYKEAKINDRLCTAIHVTFPNQREHLRFHKARIYVDNQLHFPIRFESFDWPQGETDQPILLEEYSYTNLRTNVGFTDEDFDRENPAYGFN